MSEATRDRVPQRIIDWQEIDTHYVRGVYLQEAVNQLLEGKSGTEVTYTMRAAHTNDFLKGPPPLIEVVVRRVP